MTGSTHNRTLRQRRADEALEWARVREEMLTAWARGESLSEMKIQTRTRHAWGTHLSVRTLQANAQRIYKELDVKSPAAAVAEAYRRGFLACPCSGPVRASDVRRYAHPKATT